MGSGLVKRNEGRFAFASLKRGGQYFKSGYVLNLKTLPGRAEATVSGTSPYSVTIHFHDGEIEVSHCSCPYSGWGLCKHVAAVLYAVDEKGGASLVSENRVLKDYEQFSQETHNLSVRVRSSDAEKFFEGRKEALLSRKDNWSEEETVKAVIDLFSMRLPLARYYRPEPLSLNLIPSLNLSRESIKTILGELYKKEQLIGFLVTAMRDPLYRSIVNEMLRDAMKEGREKYGYSLFYNLPSLYAFFETETFLAAVRDGEAYVDYDEMIRYLKDDKDEAVYEELIKRKRLLRPESHMLIAEHYERKGETEKAKEEYRRLIAQNSYCNFYIYIDYWKSLSEDEKRKEYDFLLAQANESKRAKPFRILSGRATERDFKGLPLVFYFQLPDEIKKGYAEIYPPHLIAAVKKRLNATYMDSDEYYSIMQIFMDYDFLLDSLFDMSERLKFHSLEDEGRRKFFLTLLRKTGHLSSYGISVYEEAR